MTDLAGLIKLFEDNIGQVSIICGIISSIFAIRYYFKRTQKITQEENRRLWETNIELKTAQKFMKEDHDKMSLQIQELNVRVSSMNTETALIQQDLREIKANYQAMDEKFDRLDSKIDKLTNILLEKGK